MQVPKRQALQIQHICSFLRVTMLSNIVDHRGTSILPAMVYPAPPAKHNQYYYQNSSTLQWPQQHPPGPAAWKTWQQFITWMYFQPNTFQLQHRLGPWLPEYQLDYQWAWQICPHMHVLFCHDDHSWWAYLPERWYPTHTGYCNQCSPTMISVGMVPATPILFDKKIHIPLPITTMVATAPPSSQPQPLATRLTTPPEAWESPLWHNIRPHAHMDSLQQALIQRKLIRLVSDVAVHPSGYGTCAWTIWSSQDLWTGEGYVPAPVMDIYSGLVEAYGIYTMLSFFH